MTEFPRMLYAADGRTMLVRSGEDEANAPSEFGREPHDVHRSPALSFNATPVAAPVPVPGNADLALSVANAVIEMMEARFDLKPRSALSNAADDLPRRGPGRPPKHPQE